MQFRRQGPDSRATSNVSDLREDGTEGVRLWKSIIPFPMRRASSPSRTNSPELTVDDPALNVTSMRWLMRVWLPATSGMRRAWRAQRRRCECAGNRLGS